MDLVLGIVSFIVALYGERDARGKKKEEGGLQDQAVKPYHNHLIIYPTIPPLLLNMIPPTSSTRHKMPNEPS